MANSSRNPDKVLRDAEEKGYSRILFQQGKPVCDFELTLLGDLSNPQRIAAPYIGSGVPAGSDGFAIGKLDVAAGDFTIKAGRCLVNGNEVVLAKGTTYKTQPHQDQVRSFPSGQANVYLRVFPREITNDEDADLNNKDDVGTVTAVREKTDWEVLVSLPAIKQPDHFLLATIETLADVANNVIDRRRKGLTMAALRDEFDALGGSGSSLNDRLNKSLNPDGTLKNNVVDNVQLANNAVTVNKIADANVTSTKLAPNAVGNTQIANNAVTANKIADGNVVATKLAANAVGNTQLADNAVTVNKIADGSVVATKLAANAVGNTQLADNAVTVNKIANASVVGSKLAPSAVANAQLADNAVTGNKIADGNVIATKLAANAVNEVNLVSNAVSKRTIQDKAVSIAKLGNSLITSAQMSIPKSTVAGIPGQIQFNLQNGEENAFFLISVHLIGPRVLGKTSTVIWMQRSICGISAAQGNPPFHQHQLVLQNFSTTDVLTVACKAYRIAET